MDYRAQQEQIYERINARSQERAHCLEVGGNARNVHALTVLLRPPEAVQAAVARLQERLTGMLGQDAVLVLDGPTLHACLANTGHNEAYREADSPAVDEGLRLIADKVHGLLRTLRHSFGGISYPLQVEIGSPLLIAPDSAILAGQPDERMLHNTTSLHEELRANEPLRALWTALAETCGMWGFHSTLTRTVVDRTLEEETVRALTALRDEVRIPPWEARTVDVLRLMSTVTPNPGGIQLDLAAREPFERFVLEEGVWKLKE